MEIVEFKFDLGSVVKENVTGFTGVVMSQIKYNTGCKHYGVQAQSLTAEGKVREWEHFDESRLALVENEKVFNEPKKSTSAPGHNPPMGMIKK